MNEDDNLSEEGLEDPYEKELREAQEQANQRNEEGFKDLTEGKIRRKRTGEEDNEEFEQLEIPFESRNLGRVGAGLAFEVGFNSLLDALTAVPGSQQVGSAVINAIAQGIRGGKFSFGEVLGAAAASQIPGLAQGKAITKAGRIMRAAGRGAASGAIDATSIAAVDEGRLPTAQELGLGIGAGGILGAGFQQAGEGASELLKNIRKRVNSKAITVFAESTDPFAAFVKQRAALNDYINRAYRHRFDRAYPSPFPLGNRPVQGAKQNLMKGFDELIKDDQGREYLLVRKKTLSNPNDIASKSNYVLKRKDDVEDEIAAQFGYEVRQDADVKFLQLIRKELNKIEQQNPKLYLSSLMEYGDSAYLEHKVARRMAKKFWKRVETQREGDNFGRWANASNRNTLNNLRLLFDPNYKTLKDTTEKRLDSLIKKKGLPDYDDPEGFIISIEDPNEAMFSARSLFVRSNPGNIQIRKAGDGRVVGIIPDFYRQIYSTEFATAYNKNFGALAAPEVDPKIRAQAGETIQQYRERIINKMLEDAVSGRGVMSEEDYLEDLAMYYGTFAGFYRRAVELGDDPNPSRWVRIPQWAMDVMSTQTDIDRFTSPTVTPANIDVDTQKLIERLDDLEAAVRALPRTKTGRIERRFARSVKPNLDEINEIRKKLNRPKFKL